MYSIFFVLEKGGFFPFSVPGEGSLFPTPEAAKNKLKEISEIICLEGEYEDQHGDFYDSLSDFAQGINHDCKIVSVVLLKVQHETPLDFVAVKARNVDDLVSLDWDAKESKPKKKLSGKRSK